MSGKKVTLTLTKAEAWGLYRLAECAANTWDDALAVLPEPAKARAGMRGIEKLRTAWIEAQ